MGLLTVVSSWLNTYMYMYMHSLMCVHSVNTYTCVLVYGLQNMMSVITLSLSGLLMLKECLSVCLSVCLSDPLI